MNKTIRTCAFIFFTFMLAACSGFFEKDNAPEPAPLTTYPEEIKPHLLWSTRTGGSSNNEYLKMSPALTPDAVITANTPGIVTSVNKLDGKINWQVNTHIPIVTGVGAGDGIIVVGSYRGEIVAIGECSGQIVWQTAVPSGLMAKPAIQDGVVVIKSIDGLIRALSVVDGHTLWMYQEQEPNLILRGASTPLIRDKRIIVGYANGNLSKFSLHDGQLYWSKPIAIPDGAFAIQRMIDIDADPILFQHHIYAATYQGQIASLDWLTGKTLWTHDISSYTGMVANQDSVFISDARGYVWSFGASTGFVNWRQVNLLHRTVTGPAIMDCYVVVGDAEGFLHWLDQRDGHFVARVSLGAAIYAAPIVENNVLYAINNRGYLTAYTLL